MRIYEMASSQNGRFFLAAESEKTVAAYEADTGRKIGEYRTHFESGGKRMCIMDDGRYFAAAAYGRFGITLYETETGHALWTTKEVKRVQKIVFSADETTLLALNADERLYTISCTDGTILSVEKAITKAFSDVALDVKLINKAQLIWNNMSANLENKKILRMCSGGGSVFCAILGGGLTCFSDSGNMVWHAESKPEEHYTRLCFCPKHNLIIGIGYKFGSSRTRPYHFIDGYSVETGDLVFSSELDTDSFEYTFVNQGEGIVSNTGKVYSLDQTGVSFTGTQLEM